MAILITGCSGFIGFHLTLEILKKKKITIIGIDNLNEYYDVNLKKNRLKIIQKYDNFIFYKKDISNFSHLKKIFKKHKVDVVINLAAQAGVRYSITNPDEYLKSNIIGFNNILNLSKEFKIKHLIFASTSSVYGDNKNFPLQESFSTEKPLSFYAASKKSNEVMAYSYSNIFKLPITCLRFFTVYGPFGRPDMALHLFTEAIMKNKPVKLFSKGNHIRDFTYVEDVVKSIVPLIKKPPAGQLPYVTFNICNGYPKKLSYFLEIIEKYLSRKSKKILLPPQKGDVYKTHGSNKLIINKTNYKINTSIEEGIKKFINWYKEYYKL